MPQRNKQDFHKRETAEVASFIDHLQENANRNGVFDSAAAADFVVTAANQSTGVKVPDKLQAVLDEVKDADTPKITRALLDGISAYETQHGTPPPADLVEQALHCAYATTDAVRRKYSLDAATSNHHDNLALQPNRAVVAILSALGEAIPFAHYLPADIGSNEALLAIMTHHAGSNYGAYAQGGIMDGAHSGDAYITSSRIHTANTDADGKVTGKLTTVQATDETCDLAAPGLKLLRGRTLVYVNGLLAAREMETDATGSGDSPINGTLPLAGVSYAVGGKINTDNGEFILSTIPAMPPGIPITVEGFVDYERAPELTPSIYTSVNVYKLHAKPWRVITRQSVDSRTQMANELGLDAYSEGVIAIQAQFGNERHYQVLAKAKRLAKNHQDEFEFRWTIQGQEKTRSQIWQDFSAKIGAVSQKMAVDTMSHGVTHLYVGRYVAAQLLGMPFDLFEPSGTFERPCIFRLGRLFKRYEVYYTPKGLVDTPRSAQILCIGRAPDVTRNPFVLGDAVPPTVLPLAVGEDLRQGAGFYARNFTAVNPHGPSSKACAMINVTDME